MPRKKSATLFEDSLKDLEEIVEQLEQGDISLEESLKSFEQGVKLTRTFLIKFALFARPLARLFDKYALISHPAQMILTSLPTKASNVDL
jgi:exodeoxyribonuclease VII small subunit